MFCIWEIRRNIKWYVSSEKKLLQNCIIYVFVFDKLIFLQIFTSLKQICCWTFLFGSYKINCKTVQFKNKTKITLLLEKKNGNKKKTLERYPNYWQLRIIKTVFMELGLCRKYWENHKFLLNSLYFEMSDIQQGLQFEKVRWVPMTW